MPCWVLKYPAAKWKVMCRYGQVSEDLCPIYSSSEKSKCLGIGSNNKDLDFGHIDLRVGHSLSLRGEPLIYITMGLEGCWKPRTVRCLGKLPYEEPAKVTVACFGIRQGMIVMQMMRAVEKVELELVSSCLMIQEHGDIQWNGEAASVKRKTNAPLVMDN